MGMEEITNTPTAAELKRQAEDWEPLLALRRDGTGCGDAVYLELHSGYAYRQRSMMKVNPNEWHLIPEKEFEEQYETVEIFDMPKYEEALHKTLTEAVQFRMIVDLAANAMGRKSGLRFWNQLRKGIPRGQFNVPPEFTEQFQRIADRYGNKAAEPEVEVEVEDDAAEKKKKKKKRDKVKV